MDEDGYIICKKCKGKKENIIKFEYKGKEFHYYSKCGHCHARGKIDWVETARGRKPGIEGWFVDTHPPGSRRIMGVRAGGNQIYDGHQYISVNTERGEALWHELVTKRSEDYDEEDET